jgi:hypothetical protein
MAFDLFASGAVSPARKTGQDKAGFDLFADGMVEPKPAFDLFADKNVKPPGPTLDEVKEKLYTKGSTHTPSREEARLLFDEEFSLGDAAKAAGGAVAGIGKTLWDARKEIGVNPLNALKLPATLIEGATRGGFDLANLVRMAYAKAADAMSEGNVDVTVPEIQMELAKGKKLRQILDERKFENFYQRLLNNLAYARERESGNLVPGVDKLPAQLQPMPNAAEAASFVLDPTVPATGGGAAAIKGGVRAMSKALGKELPEQVVKHIDDVPWVAPYREAGQEEIRLAPAVGGAMQKAGEAVEKLRGLPAQAVEGAAEKLTGDASAATKVHGVVDDIPGVDTVKKVGRLAGRTGTALKEGGKVVEELGKTSAGPFTRIDQILHSGTAPEWARKAALAVRSLGLDKAVEGGLAAGKAVAKDSARGAAAGTVLGLASAESDEELGAAVGSGAAIGAGSGAVHHVQSAPVRKRAKEDLGLATWFAKKSPEQQAAFNKLRWNRQEALRAMTAEFLLGDDVDVRYLSPEEFQARHGETRGAQWINTDGRPVVEINGGLAKNRTLFHEVFHAAATSRDLVDVGALRTMLLGVKDGTGNVVKHGLLSADEFDAMRDRYLSRLPEAQRQQMQNDPSLESRIINELGAEYFASVIEGTPDFLESSRGIRGRLIDAQLLGEKLSFVSKLIARMGGEQGSVATRSDIFGDLPKSPEVEALMRNVVRAKDRLTRRLEIDENNPNAGPTIRPADAQARGNEALVDVFADNDNFAKNPDGTVRLAGGVPVLLTEREIRRLQEDRVDHMDRALQTVPTADEPGLQRNDNGSWEGPYFSDAQLAALNNIPNHILTPSVKDKIKRINDAMRKGDGAPILINYNAALKNKKYSSSIRAVDRVAVPYAMAISKAGNYFIYTMDVTHFHNKLRRWEKSKPSAFKMFDGNTPAERVQDFVKKTFKYLQNHAQRMPGRGLDGRPETMLDADPVRAKLQADRINDFFNAYTIPTDAQNLNRLSTRSEKDLLIRSRRLDRINSIRSAGGDPMPFDYHLQKVNYQPEQPRADVNYSPNVAEAEPAKPEVTHLPTRLDRRAGVPSFYEGEPTPAKMEAVRQQLRNAPKAVAARDLVMALYEGYGGKDAGAVWKEHAKSSRIEGNTDIEVANIDAIEILGMDANEFAAWKSKLKVDPNLVAAAEKARAALPVVPRNSIVARVALDSEPFAGSTTQKSSEGPVVFGLDKDYVYKVLNRGFFLRSIEPSAFEPGHNSLDVGHSGSVFDDLNRVDRQSRFAGGLPIDIVGVIKDGHKLYPVLKMPKMVRNATVKEARKWIDKYAVDQLSHLDYLGSSGFFKDAVGRNQPIAQDEKYNNYAMADIRATGNEVPNLMVDKWGNTHAVDVMFRPIDNADVKKHSGLKGWEPPTKAAEEHIFYSPKGVDDAAGGEPFALEPDVKKLTEPEAMKAFRKQQSASRRAPEAVILEPIMKDGKPVFDKETGKVAFKRIPYDLLKAPGLGQVIRSGEAKFTKEIRAHKAKVSALRKSKAPEAEIKKAQRELVDLTHKADAEGVDAAAKLVAPKLVEEYNKWKDDPEVVAAKGWYSKVRKQLRDIFGANAELFGQLLGASSAQTDVAQNFKYAVEAIELFSKGHYDDLLKRFNDHVNSGKPASKFGEVPLRANGRKYAMNSRAVLLALHDSWLQSVDGPKTPNFAGNLTGRTLAATIDVWAARMLRRLLYADRVKRWRILPLNEGPVGYRRDVGGNLSGDFVFGQKVFEHAAKELKMEPDDLQAIMWFAEKKHWSNNKWTKNAGSELSSFESGLADLEKGGKLSRIQAGVTTFKDAPSFDRREFTKVQAELRSALRKIDGVVALRVNRGRGMFMGAAEPSFDIEMTVRNPEAKALVQQKVEEIGRRYKQMAVMVSEVVKEGTPDARPGFEVHFNRWMPSKMANEVAKTFTDAGIQGYTVMTDAKGRQIGFRSQFVPEWDSTPDGGEVFRRAVEKAFAALDSSGLSSKIAHKSDYLYGTRVTETNPNP